MVLTPVDYLLRRTNHILFMRDTLDEVKAGVVAAMIDFFGWSEEEKAAHVAELNQVIAESDLTALKGGKR